MIKKIVILIICLMYMSAVLGVVFEDKWFKDEQFNYPVITWEEVGSTPYITVEEGHDYYVITINGEDHIIKK